MTDAFELCAGPFHPWRGVFETLRVVRGRALFVEAHWANLQEAAQALELPVLRDLRDAVRGLPREDGRCRWVVTKAETRCLFTPAKRTAPRNFAVVLAPYWLGSSNADARYKTLSYLVHEEARKFAKDHRAHEGLLMNQRREAASGAMSNVAWKRGKRWFTPAPECGCRNGVTRQWLLARMAMEEGRFPAPQLDRAEEMVVLNSWLGVQPVRFYNGRALTVTDPEIRAAARAWNRECTGASTSSPADPPRPCTS